LIDRVEKLLLLAALFAILWVATTVIHDFDTFWQLQSGKYMVETQSFIRTDLFTLAADVPRFEHCWLQDLILYFGYRLGGYHALSVIKGLALGGTALALMAVARIRGASWPSMLLLSTPFWLSRGGWTARPQLWTFLFFALFVLILLSLDLDGPEADAFCQSLFPDGKLESVEGLIALSCWPP